MNRGDILQKLASGELSVDEATRLLQGEADAGAPPAIKAAAEPDGGDYVDDLAAVDAQAIHNAQSEGAAVMATAAASAAPSGSTAQASTATTHPQSPAEPASPTEDAELPTTRPEPAPNGKRKHKGGLRWLHIEVTDSSRRRDRVRVNVPVGLVRAGVWMGSKFAKNMPPALWESLLDAIDNDEIGTLVEVDDFENGEHVRIYID